MKLLGAIVLGSGVFLVVSSLVVPDERLQGGSKGIWVEERFGKKGLRIFYFVLGILLMWLGYTTFVSGHFP